MTWLIVIGLFLLAWFWQNLSHELAHLWNGFLWEGRKPLKLVPWPHVYQQRFYFARYESGVATRMGPESHRHIAPLWWGIRQQFICLGAMVMFKTMDGGGSKNWLYVLPFFICSSVDVGFWLWGAWMMRPGTDGMRYRSTANQELFGRRRVG
jgi:hypothetical protein